MQSTPAFAYHEADSSMQLQKHSQVVATLRASLWPIQGVLVSYQSNKERSTLAGDFQALDCHHNNIKKLMVHLCAECDNACTALSTKKLEQLIEHTQNAQLLFRKLDHEATHFQKIVAKRFPHSKM